MSVYRSTPIDDVVGRIIRNTRLQDASYIPDIHEWIGEMLEMVHYNGEAVSDFKCLEMNFHKAKLPCGLLWIDAVEYKGRRLARGNSVKNITTRQMDMVPESALPGPTVFTSQIVSTPTPDGNGLYFSTLNKVNQQPFHDTAYYQVELDYIQTSFECGQITVYYKHYPLDERGFPLIPDNSNLKETLYWYVRKKLIESGWQDPVFKHQECENHFEFYMGRALAELDFPSPDEMEHRVNTFRRLIMPEDYYENFFKTSGPEPFYETLRPRNDTFFL